MWKFKENHSLEERVKECEELRKRHSDRIPIVLERSARSDLKPYPPAKILCPANYKYQQFLRAVRSKFQLPQSHALYIFVNGKEMVTGDETLLSVYEKNKDPDGFLYMMYAEHPTLG